MRPYTDEDFDTDKERILDALDAIAAVQRKYADVIVVPEVITLHDVTNYRVEDEHGIVAVEEICDRRAAIALLHAAGDVNYVTQEKFEDAIVSQLHDIRTK